ncbi:hypothetical protein JA33_241 [Dickeya phage vB_DsoM_JA33]|uniref:Uncharacterized protein n=2 Tax=Salmondvirus JA11 TaxID=2734141 RepID=A0A386K5R9_9CAUD|nr:hypothetical protein HOU32_gp240 [Dickeya phage vB_DsoM_JA11]AXG67615.1 hypothetical protein JA33_241 [Dickeya phage vB_DsoM_JA33]AYD80045.1 hypothetical protein JA11_240 [Dickeya phage vB_DsoM_JA11]
MKFRKLLTRNKNRRSISASCFIGRLFFEIGVGRELWYFTRFGKNNDHRIYHLFHVGVTRLVNPSGEAHTDVLVISFLLLNIKFGWMTIKDK